MLIVLGIVPRATAADPDTAGILQRLDRLEAENQELRQRNDRLEDRFDERVRPLPPLGKQADATPANHHYTSYYAEPAADPAEAMLQLGAGMEQLQTGMEQLGAGVEELGKNLTVTTADKQHGSKIALFGALTGEMVFAEARPVLPSAITLISSDFGNNTQTAEVHAKSSYLGAAVIGPQVGCFQTGGLALAYFYGEIVEEDVPGLFMARMYGEMKNDYWRFSVGLDGDVVVPLAPTVVNWSIGNGAGNMGYQRAQFRVERYIHPHADSQWTLQFALTDPTVTSYANFDLTEGLQEDNGWPNLEGRVAWGYGPRCQLAGETKRAFEAGLSGVVGQLRRTTLGPPAIADVWAYGLDAQVRLTDSVGLKGEFFDGQTIGSYNAAIVQNFNANLQGIRSTGGWGEIYAYWAPCLHSHFGYSIDNPRDSDLTAALASRNEFVFGNIFWDLTSTIELGFEVSHWRTEYMAPLQDNDSMVYHTRFRMKF